IWRTIINLSIVSRWPYTKFSSITSVKRCCSSKFSISDLFHLFNFLVEGTILVEVRSIGIKSFLMLFGVTAALIDVNAAQSKLVMLENFNENYSKCLRLLYNVNAAKRVNAASEEVSTAELLKEFDLLKWDQQVVSELVEKL
ncbi:hypothetical protein Tco_1333408, partial [Tanacetum coccineum]